MKLDTYLKTWEGMKLENQMGRITQLLLALAVFALAMLAFKKDNIVTIQPYTLSEEAWVSNASASISYYESWGFALAQLLGNVTPTTVGFLKDRLSPLLSPAIYQEVLTAIDLQAEQFRLDRVSTRFEPRTVLYEQGTGKVFVSGYSFTRGADSSETRQERTYEFEITISNYAPMIHNLTTYTGEPRTREVLAKQQSREGK